MAATFPRVRKAASVALRLHNTGGVSEVNVPALERRRRPSGDRRRNSRSGRRASDPRFNWRRLAWLFATYAVYLSIRSLGDTIKRVFQRPTVA
jgi:hypothetical protein